MSSFTQYRTIQGDTWPLIAYKAYGDSMEFVRIIDANKPLEITEVLPSGLQINIPILEETGNGVQSALLPPWKR